MSSLYYYGFIWFTCTTSAQCMWKLVVEKHFPEQVAHQRELLAKKRLEESMMRQIKESRSPQALSPIYKRQKR